MIRTLQYLVQSDRTARLAFADQMSGSRDQGRLFALLDLWTSWWRDVLLTQSGCEAACSNVDQLDSLHTHARTIAPQTVEHYLALLQRIDGYLHHTVNVRLALDVLLLRLPRLNA